jgi:excisionase family DNA binding protein
MSSRRNAIVKRKKRVITFSGDAQSHQFELGLPNPLVISPQAPATGPPLLTTRQAAEYLNCSKSLLDKLRVRGGGPEYVQVSDDLVRYAKSALDEYIAARTRRNTAQVNVESE